ncbi:ABC transporter substrate-binding protein [Actinomadura viridis]|uniref:ABC-type branched-subunit amino acid transport system substrate-binding protein n=1 Tax=Actinomadura viridis TaxID=58110 RepID=A0A931DB67_9ACTN|nr:ABC transporter substrate-binding protein [Actinomadura viridis]MBG6087839.1 ABC-type branched-subunit amino acid transport system substrate-binding protein [Actinomadura viridis]
MKTPTTSHAGLALAVTAALSSTLLTACATSNESAAGADAPGVTGDSIKIGGVLTETSATGYSTAGAELGAKARFERANAEGGVHGRKIEFLGAEDDGMIPDKGAAAARKLVQKEKVFAVVPVSAPQFGGAEFLEQQKVPWVGWATGPFWCGKESAFGFNGCLAPKPGQGTQTWWGNQVAAQLGGAEGKKVWVQATDSTASKYAIQTMSKSFTAAGFALAGTSAALPAQAPPQDWSPYVNKIMKSAGGRPPEVLVSVMAGSKFNSGLYAALKKAGYRGLITDATSYDPKVLSDPQTLQALEGVYSAPQFEPFESTAPEIERMRADLSKVAGANAVPDQHVATGYWSADVFLKMLEKAGKDLTRDAFFKAVQSFSYENKGFGRIQFPSGKTESNGCGALVKLDGGKFTIAKSLKCFDNTTL